MRKPIKSGFALKLEAWIVRAEQGMLVSLVVFMVAMSFLQVVLRVLFSTGILWADTLLRHLVLWVGFLGAGLAASSNRQFAMDLSLRFLQGRLKTFVEIFCDLFAAAVSVFLLRASLSFFHEEVAHAQTLFAILGHNVPAWIFELILPAGFALLTVHYLLKAVQVRHSREDGNPEINNILDPRLREGDTKDL